MSIDAIRAFYVGSGRQMFDKASLLKRLCCSYNDEPLAARLRVELNRALGLNDAAAVQVMDSVDHIPDIQRAGRAYAARNVMLAHLAPFA